MTTEQFAAAVRAEFTAITDRGDYIPQRVAEQKAAQAAVNVLRYMSNIYQSGAGEQPLCCASCDCPLNE